MNATTSRLFILFVLALLMAASRAHVFDHFSPPDASWAVFFIAGFHLRGWGRWAFPALMALAVGVDWWVITGQGIDFWNHYCVSAAYWFLVPAYAAMWAGGAWLRRRYAGARWDALGRLAFAFVLSLNEYIVAYMTIGFTMETLPIKIFNALRYGYTPTMASVTVLFVAIAATIFGLVARFGDLPRLLGAMPSKD